MVWAENTDKKTKAKDSWFLALIVAPTASDTATIRTKKEFLIRSFKDGRYYTVSKKDTHRFRHNESPMKKNNDNPALKEGITFELLEILSFSLIFSPYFEPKLI